MGSLREARLKRGWTYYKASQHMRSVTPQMLRNLEGEGATRITDPLEVRVSTALEILRVYHPDIQLDEFVGERSLYKLVPTDPGARRSLERYAAKNFANSGEKREQNDGGKVVGRSRR